MFKRRKAVAAELLNSALFGQDDFYAAFLDDLGHAKRQVIIESPFITAKRMRVILPIFRQLAERGVQVIVNTKPLDEHEPYYASQASAAIAHMQKAGVIVLFTFGHHRKIAVIDSQVLWGGSLNILSQNNSCEFMRRISSVQLAHQMLTFLRLEEHIG